MHTEGLQSPAEGEACSISGSKYDPEMAAEKQGGGENYTKQCSLDTHPMDQASRCAVGDITNKAGRLNPAASETGTMERVYVVPNLPLHGANSIVGRSVVLSYDNSSMLACGPIYEYATQSSTDGAHGTSSDLF